MQQQPPPPQAAYYGGQPQQQQQLGGYSMPYAQQQQQQQQPMYGQQPMIQQPQQPMYGHPQQQQFQQPMYSQTNPSLGMPQQQQQQQQQPGMLSPSQQQYRQQQQPSYTNQPQQQSYPQQQQQQQPRRAMMRPPYIDPNTQIMYDVDDPEYEGWLTKQSVWMKEWRRRYFFLKGTKLFFGKNAVSAPHGMMDLAICTTVKSADLKAKKRHSFEISTSDTCYLLYADTEGEKDDWIGRVGKAIVRSSRTFASAGPAAGEGGEEDEDDIYENDDPENPYFND